jgi:lipid II isoglutaminyl synthase (glutamine-hydrolysing)
MSSKKQQAASSKSLKIGWLYPSLMSTYGDRGNIIVLQRRCEWRGIHVEIVNIDENTSDSELNSVNILFGGGAQDREQEMVMSHLRKKRKQIAKLIDDYLPALLVCGSPQLFGHYYEPSEGKRIDGLGIFDLATKHPGPRNDRLIGNVIAKSQIPELHDTVIVGFENHGGRTYLGKNAKPFANIIKGSGNNGEDGTEGVLYRNAIGSYLHGPLLPKNSAIADWLIKKALRLKYKEEIVLEQLDDTFSERAKQAIAQRLGVQL